jgi:hypothetical protein
MPVAGSSVVGGTDFGASGMRAWPLQLTPGGGSIQEGAAYSRLWRASSPAQFRRDVASADNSSAAWTVKRIVPAVAFDP